MSNPQSSPAPSSSAAVTGATTNPVAVQLNSLPPGWQAVKHVASGKYYYHNTKTREVSWTLPPPPMPSPNQGDDDLSDDSLNHKLARHTRGVQ